jgi:hypothetical protein
LTTAAARQMAPRRMVAGQARRLAGWVSDIKLRLVPTTYVDYADIPDDAPSPYRARLTLPRHVTETQEDLREREVVRGKVRIVYELRCPCGRRWFSTRLEYVRICPRCDRAVVIKDPN